MVTRPRDCSWVSADFENITSQDFDYKRDCKSDPDDDYNCIAWAVGKTDNWWWPNPTAPYYWPNGLPKEPPHVAETLANFIAAFQTEGFKRCWNGRYSGKYEKVAIFVNNKGRPTHAARLLTTGAWSSKLGPSEDIEHRTLECIQGRGYGRVAVFLKRKLPLEKTNPIARLRSFLSQLLRKPPSKSSPIPKETPTAS